MALSAIVSGAGWLITSVASAGGTTVARAAAASAVRIDATLAADGSLLAASAGGWEAQRVALGAYEVTFAHPVDLTIRRWDVPAAGAAVRPIVGTTWLVTFDGGDGPVDTGFSFEAVPAP